MYAADLIKWTRFLRAKWGIPRAFRTAAALSTRANSATPKKVAVYVPGFRHPIYLRPGTSDASVFVQIFVNEQYKSSVRPERSVRNVVDCGANNGCSAIYFSKTYPSATIFAIEPETSNFELLLANTEKYSNIVPLQAAVWAEDSYAIICDAAVDKWAFQVKPAEGELASCIKALSLPTIFQTLSIDLIDILKIDIEGAELDLFSRGAESWLPRVGIIMIELHDRFRPGSSASFYRAVAAYDFVQVSSGEVVTIKLPPATPRSPIQASGRSKLLDSFAPGAGSPLTAVNSKVLSTDVQNHNCLQSLQFSKGVRGFESDSRRVPPTLYG